MEKGGEENRKDGSRKRHVERRGEGRRREGMKIREVEREQNGTEGEDREAACWNEQASVLAYSKF